MTVLAPPLPESSYALSQGEEEHRETQERAPKSLIHRGCGIAKVGVGERGEYTTYRVPCKSRRCQMCQPGVIGEKMSRFPAIPLFAQEIHAEHWQSMGDALRYKRTKGVVGDYCRIPTAYDRFLVISDDPSMGKPIAYDQIESMMFDARPEWGSITFSKGWGTTAPPVQTVRKLRDLGPVRAPIARVQTLAKNRGIPYMERHASITFYPRHEWDEDYLEAIMRIHEPDPHPGDFIENFVARIRDENLAREGF